MTKAGAPGAELEAVREGSDPARSEEALRERFRRGHLCFVAVADDGSVDHVRRAATDPALVPEAGRHLRLPPGDVYFYDGFTRPGARRRALDGLVRTAIFRAMRERGFRRAVSHVRLDNRCWRGATRWSARA